MKLFQQAAQASPTHKTIPTKLAPKWGIAVLKILKDSTDGVIGT
jgi:hypothetical protein